MWFALKRLALGLTLIAGASALLLVSDLQQRRSGPGTVPRVAVLKYASRPLLDDTVRGMIDGLAQVGYVPGKTISLRIYDAQNDMPTAASIAKEITDGRYDLVLTASTPCLQAVANANRQGKAMHVFAAVTDPFGAGVGISRDPPTDHPAHLVGIGTFQPVAATFRLAKGQLFPGLAKAGVVWNAAEACSEACTRIARQICTDLHIELLEANVENSAEVLDAANSLVARGAQVLWIGGDNTVELACDAVVHAARRGRIPVISNSPDIVTKGLLMALGANYSTWGCWPASSRARSSTAPTPRASPSRTSCPNVWR